MQCVRYTAKLRRGVAVGYGVYPYCGWRPALLAGAKKGVADGPVRSVGNAPGFNGRA